MIGVVSPLAWALVSWKSAQTLTTHGFSSGRVLASCIYALLYGAVVAMETAQLLLNPYQAF